MMKPFATILLLLFTLTSFNAYSQNDEAKAEHSEKRVTLQIKGMACELCAQSLENLLAELEGISILEIDPKEGFAKLSFKKGKLPDDDQLKEAVENAGFVLEEINANQEKESSGELSDNK